MPCYLHIWNPNLFLYLKFQENIAVRFWVWIANQKCREIVLWIVKICIHFHISWAMNANHMVNQIFSRKILTAWPEPYGVWSKSFHSFFQESNAKPVCLFSFIGLLLEVGSHLFPQLFILVPILGHMRGSTFLMQVTVSNSQAIRQACPYP